jgi:hypothetical protein
LLLNFPFFLRGFLPFVSQHNQYALSSLFKNAAKQFELIKQYPIKKMKAELRCLLRVFFSTLGI